MMEKTEQTHSKPNHNRHDMAEVASMLDRLRDEIAEAWILLLLPMQHPDNSSDLAGMKALALGFLEDLSKAFYTGSYDVLDQHISRSATRLYAQGDDISIAMTSLGLGRAAMLDVLRRVYPTDADFVLDCIYQLDRYWNYCSIIYSKIYVAEIEGQLVEFQRRTQPNYCAASYNRRYTAEIERQLLRHLAQTQSVLDTARAASSTQDLDEILAHVAKMIGKALGVSNCIVVAIDEEQKLLLFRQAGVVGIFTDEHDTMLSVPDHDLSLEEIPSFNLLLLKHKKPIIVDHANHNLHLQTLRKFLPGAKSVLGLPFTIKDRIVGLAFVWTTNDNHTFSPEDLDLAQGIANVAALAIDNARLYGEAGRLARIKERQRIALELHDNVAQLSFSIGLHADQALKDSTLSETSRSHLSTIEHLATRSGFELRSAIFSLEHLETGDESELVGLLRELVNDFQGTSGIRATLILPDKMPAVSSTICTLIYRVVRESLYNVQKHARASAALVSLHCDDHSITVSIQDDGVGLPNQLICEQIEDSLHFGLAAIRHMVQETEGEFTITNNDDGGALVKVRLPLVGR